MSAVGARYKAFPSGRSLVIAPIQPGRRAPTPSGDQFLSRQGDEPLPRQGDQFLSRQGDQFLSRQGDHKGSPLQCTSSIWSESIVHSRGDLLWSPCVFALFSILLTVL